MLIRSIVINLLLFAVYCALIVINSATGVKGFNIAIGIGICIALQVLLNFVAGSVFLVMSKKELGKSLLISGAILCPVGFCTWLILLSIFG